MKRTIPLPARHLMLLAMILTPWLVRANLTGPYTADASTLVLLHLNEAAGNSVTANVGSLGGNFISVNYSSDTTPLTVVTTMLGATGYSTNSPTAISFGNCESNTTAGYELGYDYNKDGVFEPDTGSATSLDFLGMTNLNIGKNGQTPFTLEALIQPTTTAGAQEIICTDSSAANSSRAFQFRVYNGSLGFNFIANSAAISGTIPTTGPNAFVPNAWYHVAFTYDGTTGTLYWTRLDPSMGAASVLISGPLTIGTADGAITGPLIIANRGRPTGTETFLGAIDEVRISSVCRAANQMAFYSPTVTISQNPVSQNVDYNQPVTFSVGASSLSTLGYQWRFNSNSIAGATNTSYFIKNAAAGNAGYYDVVVTNTTGSSGTSAEALLVVGAANFLSHRYSFTSNADDSIGGADGALFGDAVVTNGSLVLDGTTGTYMQLATNLIAGANALTVEFWATYGVNSDNAYAFSFGATNYILNYGIYGYNFVSYSPHNASGQGLYISAGSYESEQDVTAPGTLDGLTMHVACVIDPPDQTLAIYTNGVLEAIDTNMTVSIAELNDVYSYIGASLDAADPYLNASIDELRIYNGALSVLSLAQSDLLGPNQILAYGPASFVLNPTNTTIPVGQAVTFASAAIGYLPISYQWFKNGTLVPGATNASYSFTTVIGDNRSTVTCYATNTIGVTTYVTNSATATLTVFTPPTLAWLGTADGGSDNYWNTSSPDWTNAAGGGGIVAFAQNDGVLLDDRASGSTTLDLQQIIIPYNIKMNAASEYILTSSAADGLLSGPGYLAKQNSGTLIIDVTNNLTGPVTISSGILQIGNNDSSGTLGSGPVTNNATLSLDRGDTALVIGNSIHGTGTLSIDGSGTVAITGTSDFTGNTLINQGILNLQNTSGLGSSNDQTVIASGGQLYLTVNANLTLAGLSLNGNGDGNGALRKGGAGSSTLYGPVTLASASTIGIDGGATLIVSNRVSGAAALTVSTPSGTGTLALNSANNYSGGTTLAGATTVIDVNANGALGSGPVSVTGAGYFLLANGLNFANSLDAATVAPGVALGLLMVNDNTNNIVTTISGPLTFEESPESGGNFIGPVTSGYLNVTGPVTNVNSGLISVRNGFVRFSGGGNYTAFDVNQGTTSLGANNGLCTNAALAVAESAAATFDLNGFDQILTGLSDGAAFAELVTNSAAGQSTLTLDLSSGTTYSGVIGGNLALVENGSQNLYLAGTNTYTGNTTVNGGTLELAQPSLAANSKVTVATGANLQLDFSETNTVAGLVLNGVSQPVGLYNNTTSSQYITGSGSLQVTPFIATNPTNITASVSGTSLTLSWPGDHKGWILQSQTNSLSRGLTTNWVDIAGSSSGTNAVIKVAQTNAAVFYRLRYPTQQ